jgi:RNA recognition motif-containing protein
MSSKLYVGNLPYSVTDDSLRSNFSEYGAVASAKVMTDRETGRSKGFGFVEMGSSKELQTAIDALNGKEMNGRSLTVNEARPREERATSGSGSRGFGGGDRNPYGNGRRY